MLLNIVEDKKTHTLYAECTGAHILAKKLLKTYSSYNLFNKDKGFVDMLVSKNSGLIRDFEYCEDKKHTIKTVYNIFIDKNRVDGNIIELTDTNGHLEMSSISDFISDQLNIRLKVIDGIVYSEEKAGSDIKIFNKFYDALDEVYAPDKEYFRDKLKNKLLSLYKFLYNS